MHARVSPISQRRTTAPGSQHLPSNPPQSLFSVGSARPVACWEQDGWPNLPQVPWEPVTSTLCLPQSSSAWHRAQPQLRSRALERKMKRKTSDYRCTDCSSSDASGSLIQLGTGEGRRENFFPVAAVALFRTILHPWHSATRFQLGGKILSKYVSVFEIIRRGKKNDKVDLAKSAHSFLWWGLWNGALCTDAVILKPLFSNKRGKEKVSKCNSVADSPKLSTETHGRHTHTEMLLAK